MKDKYDIVVLGGGPGGVCAAAAASKAGADVLLVERYGFLGGMATAGLVNPFMSFKMKGENLTNPMFNDLIYRMESVGALSEDQHTFDDEMMKYVLDVMMGDYRVDVLFHAKYVSSIMDGKKIKAVQLDLLEGMAEVAADIFIDSTGNGDVAGASGARVEVGREEDGLCQPMTLCFRIGGIEWEGDDCPDIGEFRKRLTDVYLEAKSKGDIECPRENILLFRTLIPTIIHFNTTRVVKKSAIVSQEMTDAEIEARRQAVALTELFKKEVPEFKNSYLLKLAAQIGIRESRRAMSSYSITADDVEQGLKHQDGITKCTYPIDIHSPTGEGTIIKRVPEGDWYEIPYRCLVPDGVDNLLTGGRSISSDHAGHSSLRVMPYVASFAEAAGIAGAKCVSKGIIPREIDGAELKKELNI